MIDAFIDIRKALRIFSEGTLTLSGGVGLYPGHYPINLMASETEVLEKAAKNLPEKNGIAVFEPDAAYAWPVFISNVLDDKYRTLETFFAGSERGKAFLYHLLDLLRSSEEKIQYARYVYLLSRMEPEDRDNKEAIENYRAFAGKMVEWYQNPDERGALITAIYLYVYRTRDREREVTE